MSHPDPSLPSLWEIIPLIALGSALNIGFISIFVVKNLFNSTLFRIKRVQRKIQKKIDKLPPKAIQDPNYNSLSNYNERVNILSVCFLPCIAHNLIHVLAIFYSFIFLILICFKILNDNNSLAFHISVFFLIICILETFRILRSITVIKRKNVGYLFVNKKIPLEEDVIPVYWKNWEGLIVIFLTLVVGALIYFKNCHPTQNNFSEKTIAILLVINLYSVILAKLIYNIASRIRLSTISYWTKINY